VRTIATITACTVVLATTATADARAPRHLRPHVDPCLEAIVDRENPSWNPTVYNRGGSGAYGLPQALPGHKMASAGHDWRTNPVTQLKWMRQYVASRYGGSCAAWRFWQRHGWY
jgi:hypothetical protein